MVDQRISSCGFYMAMLVSTILVDMALELKGVAETNQI